MNEIENALKYFKSRKNMGLADTVQHYEDIAIAALEMQQADRWIPISEKLPEIGNDYLVTMQQDNVFHGKTFVNWASYDGNFYDSIDGTIFDNVTAWRPLPEYYDPLAEKIQKVLDREHDRISGKI